MAIIGRIIRFFSIKLVFSVLGYLNEHLFKSKKYKVGFFFATFIRYFKATLSVLVDSYVFLLFRTGELKTILYSLVARSSPCVWDLFYVVNLKP